jgi:drug/metabolite transporter (DMT)-like permease
LLGLIGVVMFAMTFPMTRLAVGDVSAPQMSPAFVTAARAALAGLLSIGYLRWVGRLRCASGPRPVSGPARWPGARW